MLDPEKMRDLSTPARLDVGRAYNAMVKYRQADYELARCRAEMEAALIKLRAVYGLASPVVADMLGVSKWFVIDRTVHYRDPRLNPRQRDRNGRYIRPDRRLAGMRAAPDQAPNLLRTERNVRELRGEEPDART